MAYMRAVPSILHDDAGVPVRLMGGGVHTPVNVALHVFLVCADDASHMKMCANVFASASVGCVRACACMRVPVHAWGFLQCKDVYCRYSYRAHPKFPSVLLNGTAHGQYHVTVLRDGLACPSGGCAHTQDGSPLLYRPRLPCSGTALSMLLMRGNGGAIHTTGRLTSLTLGPPHRSCDHLLRPGPVLHHHEEALPHNGLPLARQGAGRSARRPPAAGPHPQGASFLIGN